MEKLANWEIKLKEKVLVSFYNSVKFYKNSETGETFTKTLDWKFINKEGKR